MSPLDFFLEHLCRLGIKFCSFREKFRMVTIRGWGSGQSIRKLLFINVDYISFLSIRMPLESHLALFRRMNRVVYTWDGIFALVPTKTSLSCKNLVWKYFLSPEFLYSFKHFYYLVFFQQNPFISILIQLIILLQMS